MFNNAALAQASDESAPESDDVTVFDPSAPGKELEMAKALAADLKSVRLSSFGLHMLPNYHNPRRLLLRSFRCQSWRSLKQLKR